MTLGITTTKLQLDAISGGIALDLAKVMREIEELHHFLLITPDSTLVALGYTSAEVATLKSAFTDGDKLGQIYEGTVNLPTAQDFRLNLSQLAGYLVT